jgi:excisionase family DNA binding protein
MNSRSPAARPEDALVSLREARKYLGGISPQTLYRLVADGDLRLVKLRRRSFIRIADLERLVAASTRQEHR